MRRCGPRIIASIAIAALGASVGLVACAPVAAPPHPTDRAPTLAPGDVAILLPLPRDPASPVLTTIAGDGAALVDPEAFAALVTTPGDIAPKTGAAYGFADHHVVAVRFDLCDRSTIGACPRDVDGRLRLVLQPLYRAAGVTVAHDIAVHAFYPIPAGELRAVIDELRGLAALQGLAPDAPLGVSPAAAAGHAGYLARLRALVLRYARADRLVRLTTIGQRAGSAAFAWVFRGVDLDGPRRIPIAIPGTAGAEQRVRLAGGDTIYDLDPPADLPAGFALAANGARFAAATPAERVAAVEALTALQNPTLHDTVDLPCVDCHVATYLTARRAATTGIAAAGVAGRFTASRARAIETIASRDPRVVRAFGWAGRLPAISQRVANDTAEVLAEIEARW